MPRKRTLIIAIGVAIVVPVAGTTICLATSDLSEWRGALSRMASNALDRDLELSIGTANCESGIANRDSRATRSPILPE